MQSGVSRVLNKNESACTVVATLSCVNRRSGMCYTVQLDTQRGCTD